MLFIEFNVLFEDIVIVASLIPWACFRLCYNLSLKTILGFATTVVAKPNMVFNERL
jgi:hypothetical protein